MSSFAQQIMEPGGGLLLIPFVRVIIGILLVLTLSGFLAGIARIHMVVLSFLSAGLLISISMFEREYKKAQRNRGGGGGGGQAPPQEDHPTRMKRLIERNHCDDTFRDNSRDGISMALPTRLRLVECRVSNVVGNSHEG